MKTVSISSLFLLSIFSVQVQESLASVSLEALIEATFDCQHTFKISSEAISIQFNPESYLKEPKFPCFFNCLFEKLDILKKDEVNTKNGADFIKYVFQRNDAKKIADKCAASNNPDLAECGRADGITKCVLAQVADTFEETFILKDKSIAEALKAKI